MNATHLCEVHSTNPPAGVVRGTMTFEVGLGKKPRFVGGPGYVDGASKHIAEALQLALDNVQRFGYSNPIDLGVYTYQFKPIV